MRPHIFLFILGTFYYLIVPPLVGLSASFADMPGMKGWLVDFNYSKNNLPVYFIIVISYLLSFIFGSFAAKKIKIKNTINATNKNKNKGSFLICFFGFVFLLIISYLAIKNMATLFGGYQTYDAGLLGAFATISSVSLFFAIYSRTRITKIVFITNILVCCIFMIGLGSRMYAVIPIVAVFVYKIYYSKNEFSKKKVLFFSFFLIIFFLMVGAWRVGRESSFEFLAYIFFAEPTFTWWSASSFMGNNQLNAVGYPLNFLQSFFNFLPSFLFENKGELILDMRNVYNYESPLGADSIFVSIIVNFGVIGGVFFIAIVGFYYSLMDRLSWGSRFFFAYYISIVAILPFQFFRDNFSIVNKQVFWNMLIIPAAIIFISLIIFNILPKKLVSQTYGIGT